MKLFDAQTADGNSASMHLRTGANRNIDQLYTVYAWGDFGGGTVTLQISPDNVNWFTVDDIALTADGCVNAEFRAHWVRGVLAGATAPSVSLQLV